MNMCLHQSSIRLLDLATGFVFTRGGITHYL